MDSRKIPVNETGTMVEEADPTKGNVGSVVVPIIIKMPPKKYGGRTDEVIESLLAERKIFIETLARDPANLLALIPTDRHCQDGLWENHAPDHQCARCRDLRSFTSKRLDGPYQELNAKFGKYRGTNLEVVLEDSPVLDVHYDPAHRVLWTNPLLSSLVISYLLGHQAATIEQPLSTHLCGDELYTLWFKSKTLDNGVPLRDLIFELIETLHIYPIYFGSLSLDQVRYVPLAPHLRLRLSPGAAYISHELSVVPLGTTSVPVTRIKASVSGGDISYVSYHDLSQDRECKPYPSNVALAVFLSQLRDRYPDTFAQDPVLNQIADLIGSDPLLIRTDLASHLRQILGFN